MASAPSQPVPTFLVSAPYSGAAALRDLLNLNPAINIAPPFDFLVEAITPEGRMMKPNAFLRSVEYNSKFKRLGFSIPPATPMAGIAQAMFDQVIAAKPDAVVHGFTLQHDFDRILWLWPEARFIHLVRDGRDVAVSNVRSRRSGTLWHAIADWTESETLWERMSHKLPPDRQFTLRYEVLVSETDYELRRLCDYLGVPFDPTMMDQIGTFAREHSGLWRKADPKEISAAEHRAARFLLQNSFFLSGTVRPPSIFKRIKLNTLNRWAIASRNRDLLGTSLWIKGILIDRFGSRKAKARMKRRRFDILSRHEDE